MSTTALVFVIILVLVFWAIAPIFVAEHIGSEKNRMGWAWGLFLGWYGVLIVAVLQPPPEQDRAAANQRAEMYRECPHCKEQMRRNATTCPHCRGASNLATIGGAPRPDSSITALVEAADCVLSDRFYRAVSLLLHELHAAMNRGDAECVERVRDLSAMIVDSRAADPKVENEAIRMRGSAKAWLSDWEAAVGVNSGTPVELPADVHAAEPAIESDAASSRANALDIVRERYARSEISREDYHLLLADLA